LKDGKEIDFYEDGILYQVSYEIANEKTKKREVEAFYNFSDISKNYCLITFDTREEVDGVNVEAIDDYLFKRNEKCPCGSGKIFKKCCMKEYREAKKDVITTAKLSSYTPLQPLSKAEKEAFTHLYQDLLIFSNQHENQFDAVYLESEDEQTTTFLARLS